MKHSFHCFFLIFLLVLMISGCTSEPAAEKQSEKTTEEPIVTQAEPFYTVVYPDREAGKETASLAASLRKTVNAVMGEGYAAIATDWVDRGKTVGEVRASHEILIGDTNRPESVSAIADLSENTADQFDYLIRNDGEHYVICASDGFLEDAVNAFIRLIKEDPAYLEPAPKGLLLSEKHTFGKASVILADRLISDYTAIVYPDSYSDREKEELMRLQSTVFEYCGTYLPLVRLSENAPDPAIRIRAVTDPSLNEEGGPYSFSVSCDAGGVSVCGRDFFGEWRGIMYLLEQITDPTGMNVVNADYRRLTPHDTIGRAAWLMGAPGCLSDPELLADCAGCGFNIVILNPPGDSFFPLALQMAELELQGLWMKCDLDRYYNTDVCWGYYLVDEPNAGMFPELSREASLFRSRHPDTRLYINMLPSQALPETMLCPTYDAFLDRFFDELKPSYASVDDYALRKFGDAPEDLTVSSTYYYGLNRYAEECRTRGIPYGAYIQSVTFSENTRQITENDLRFQTFSCLVFGYRDIQYYTYVTSDYTNDSYVGALVDRSFAKRPIWEGARKLNRELNAFGCEYVAYSCLGTFCAGTSQQAFTQFDGQYTDFPAITEVNTDGCAVIGCFVRGKDDYAFFCANTADPDIPADDITVTVTLTEGSGITLWQNGIPSEIKAVNGKVSFVLPTADGVFAQIH